MTKTKATTQIILDGSYSEGLKRAIALIKTKRSCDEYGYRKEALTAIARNLQTIDFPPMAAQTFNLYRNGGAATRDGLGLHKQIELAVGVGLHPEPAKAVLLLNALLMGQWNPKTVAPSQMLKRLTGVNQAIALTGLLNSLELSVEAIALSAAEIFKDKAIQRSVVKAFKKGVAVEDDLMAIALTLSAATGESWTVASLRDWDQAALTV